MRTGAFLVPSHLQTADRIISSNSQYGLAPGLATAADGNEGKLKLRVSGEPSAETSLTVSLQRGGNPTLGVSPDLGTPGTSVIWSEDPATEPWFGFSDTIYLTYCYLDQATGFADYPGVSTPRELPDGSLGYVFSVSSGSIVFAKKADRSSAVTLVAITTDITWPDLITDCRPDFIVLPSGRLLAAFAVDGLSTGEVVICCSDDNGTTWTLWSDKTRISVSTARTICMEYTQDSICIVIGPSPATGVGAVDIRIHWSSDAGQTFSLAQSTADGGIPRTCVTATGQVLLAMSNGTTGIIEVYTAGVGGGITYNGTGCGNSDTTRPICWIATRDDGVVFGGGVANFYPSSYIQLYASIDHGANFDEWYTAGAVHQILYNADPTTNDGIGALSAGFWKGRLVVLVTTDVTSGGYDNSILQLHFGGWDTLTERFYSTSNGAPAGWSAATGGALLPIDLPENFDWTRTDVGTGASAQPVDGGIRITATGAGNSYWDAGATLWPLGSVSTSSSFRIRSWFQWVSGTAATGQARIFVAVSDGVNRQWFELDYGPDTIVLRDNSGTIATSANVANQFKSYTEIFIAFKGDYPAAGAGLISVWYRIAGSDAWTALVMGATVAEQAGTATERLSIGGSVAHVCSWIFGGLNIAFDDNGMSGGFTTPEDLAGRQLSPTYDIALDDGAGMHLGGAGHLGIAGDTYVVATTYTHAASLIWANNRPSSMWQSAADSIAATVTFDAGANDVFDVDTVCLIGTNFQVCHVQLNATNAWGGPSVAIKLDATVAAIVGLLSRGPGYVRVAVITDPHQYRSAESRRWYVRLEHSGSGLDEVYEITDSRPTMAATTLYIEGVDFTAVNINATASIFADRMAALASPAQYRFMRLIVNAQPTSLGRYTVGNLSVGRRYEYTVIYANGFKDRTDYGVSLTTTDSGQRFAARKGPSRRTLEIAWDPLWRGRQRMSPVLQALHDACDGSLRPIFHIRDLENPNGVVLYRISTPSVIENISGEAIGSQPQPLDRPAQVTLSEEL